MVSAVFHAFQPTKPRLFGHGHVANPRDTHGYRCGLRLALTKNPSVLFVLSSMKHCTRWIVILTLALLAGWAQAKEAVPAAEDPALEARMLRIATELRCLVCQNQTIADSHAELAVDLRNQVKEMLKRGDSDQMIIDYMTARYGDFVLYRPPLKGTTMILWFGPAVLLLGGLVTLYVVLRRRSRLSPDEFEPDPDDETAVVAASDVPARTRTSGPHD